MRLGLVLFFLLDTACGIVGLAQVATFPSDEAATPQVTVEADERTYYTGSDGLCHALRPLGDKDWYYDGNVAPVYCEYTG
ncbi:MAG: hypothetical protein HKN04_14595 [Rhodothermaceae bacterium]|nr:hypothetical protein [Rhodothermaceae bacterium]